MSKYLEIGNEIDYLLAPKGDEGAKGSLIVLRGGIGGTAVAPVLWGWSTDIAPVTCGEIAVAGGVSSRSKRSRGGSG